MHKLSNSKYYAVVTEHEITAEHLTFDLYKS